MASEKGHTSWNKGIKGCWSKEAIDKIRAAQIGRTCWKARAIGDERIDKSGYIRVKVCNDIRFDKPSGRYNKKDMGETAMDLKAQKNKNVCHWDT